MTPYKHAESSANKWGGIAEDYLYIHRWFDETKAFTGDWTHRALRHHSAGIEWACKILGDVVPVYVLGKERNIPTKSCRATCTRGLRIYSHATGLAQGISKTSRRMDAKSKENHNI